MFTGWLSRDPLLNAGFVEAVPTLFPIRDGLALLKVHQANRTKSFCVASAGIVAAIIMIVRLALGFRGLEGFLG